MKLKLELNAAETSSFARLFDFVHEVAPKHCPGAKETADHFRSIAADYENEVVLPTEYVAGAIRLVTGTYGKEIKEIAHGLAHFAVAIKSLARSFKADFDNLVEDNLAGFSFSEKATFRASESPRQQRLRKELASVEESIQYVEGRLEDYDAPHNVMYWEEDDIVELKDELEHLKRRMEQIKAKLAA